MFFPNHRKTPAPPPQETNSDDTGTEKPFTKTELEAAMEEVRGKTTPRAQGLLYELCKIWKRQ